jgi:hypothetical protein
VPRPRAAVLLVLTVSLLAACSTGDDEGSSATTRRPASSTTMEPATTTTAPPQYTGDPTSAFCTFLRDTDPTGILDGDPGDPASVQAAFGRLVAVLTDATEVAPEEIAADVALVAGGIEALDAALAAVGYDVDALAASSEAAQVTAAVNDPIFTDAGARLSAYRTQVCQL